MARKYARFGEKFQSSECSKRSCKWQGVDGDKKTVEKEPGYLEYVCPKCGNNEFYGLLKPAALPCLP